MSRLFGATMAAGVAALLLNVVLVSAPAYADGLSYNNLSCPGVGVCTFDIPIDQSSTNIPGVYASSYSLDNGFYDLSNTPFNAIMNCTDAQVDEVTPDGILLLSLQPYQGYSDGLQAQTATVCFGQPQIASNQSFALRQLPNRDLDLGLTTGRRIHHHSCRPGLDCQGRHW